MMRWVEIYKIWDFLSLSAACGSGAKRMWGIAIPALHLCERKAKNQKNATWILNNKDRITYSQNLHFHESHVILSLQLSSSLQHPLLVSRINDFRFTFPDDARNQRNLVWG